MLKMLHDKKIWQIPVLDCQRSRTINPAALRDIMNNKYQFWIDRGGTFTDIVAVNPDGTTSSHKYLSENPDHYDDAALFGMRQIIGVAEGAPFPASQVEAIKMGTTVATNALLERCGERTIFLTTKGFGDAIHIGDQRRPQLFALDVKATQAGDLYDQAVEIDERMAADGEIITPLDTGACRALLVKARGDGFNSIAIGFLHAYKNPAHEDAAAQIATELGFEQITTSAKAIALMKFVPRCETAIADAYLSPVLYRYIRKLEAAVAGTPLYFMQSNGGVARSGFFRGKDAILSGPAGGIVGAVECAKAAGYNDIISFDMGGTSSDVAHYSGGFERTEESLVAGIRLKVPMLDIHTVAAGGGSICSFRDGSYRVGPASAGARPGPACYGLGGPICVSDCNLVVGHLRADTIAHVFGPAGNAPLDIEAARNGLRAIADKIEAATGKRPTPDNIAHGFLEVANEHMSRAIKKISVERGHNIKTHVMVAFGGAGGQHAAKLAERLGVNRVLVPPMAGVLSALGIGLARTRNIHKKAVEVALDPAGLQIAAQVIEGLQASATKSLIGQGVRDDQQSQRQRLYLRYQGSDTALAVANGDLPALIMAFEGAHKQLFGFIQPGTPITIEAGEVEALGPSHHLPAAILSGGGSASAPTAGKFYDGLVWLEAPLLSRAGLHAGIILDGPAMIADDHGTNILPQGWRATVLGCGSLLMERAGGTTKHASETELDPVLLEIFNNRFMGVAEEMGAILERTAHSVNMKERLDFSCAVFDTAGQLVANAPHMPVHLGSMGESVRTVAERNKGKLVRGDAIMLNDPYHGGTHLPDITIVMPVFLDDDEKPSYFVASRGHHADIGGITPGSMPSESSHLEEEGVMLDNVALLRAGALQDENVRALLAGGKYPARNVDQNMADLKAQVASCEKGIGEMQRMADEFGRDVVAAYMLHVQNNAEEAVRKVIEQLEDGAATYPLDNGAVIKVAITINREARTARIDFTGTSPQMTGNFNAPTAVTSAAVLYVFRAMVGEDIPLNAGCLIPLEIIIPKSSLLNPDPPAAVVAGNVETSQAITNALLLALSKLAASQGTMNNFTFGNGRYQYYETIAGGSGAGHGFDGASATQVHMTNSRLTDPEVLEWRYPVRLMRFSLRRGSGGGGCWCGGDGTIREILFHEDMEVAILASHRDVPPPGCNGGQPGMAGINRIIRADGTIQTLKGTVTLAVASGDIIRIDTPGGGGYGTPDE
jgi:5-oxoprolinase (ATP-hydrolysing)